MTVALESLGIGVTGHRLDGLKDADRELLRVRIKGIFSLLLRLAGQRQSRTWKGHGGCAPAVRVISPLAEGADQIVAQEGLSAGCELHCPLPFGKKDYERDFSTPESLGRFRSLLEKASSVGVIGKKGETEEERDAAYVSAGREVLRHSDILVAIWDGNPAKGKGGTAQIVEEARQAGIPVVWVHSQAPHRVEILLSKKPGKR